jgi:chromosome segregation ATPase
MTDYKDDPTFIKLLAYKEKINSFVNSAKTKIAALKDSITQRDKQITNIQEEIKTIEKKNADTITKLNSNIEVLKTSQGQQILALEKTINDLNKKIDSFDKLIDQMTESLPNIEDGSKSKLDKGRKRKSKRKSKRTSKRKSKRKSKRTSKRTSKRKSKRTSKRKSKRKSKITSKRKV